MLDSNKKRKIESADALDDDFEVDVGSDAAADIVSIHDGEFDMDPDSDSASPDGHVNGGPATQLAVKKTVVTPEEKRERRRERKQVTKKRKAEEQDQDGQDGQDEASEQGVLSVDQQSDILALLVRTHSSRELSSIELDDLTIPTSAFLDTSSSSFRGVRTLETVLEFIKTHSTREQLSVAPKQTGTPHTLVVAASAIRVADLCRALKPLKSSSPTSNSDAIKKNTSRESSKGETSQASSKKGKKDEGDVAKLFGKEKIGVQCTWLQKTRVNVAVGVPSRLSLCIEKSALKTDKIEQIYLDASYRDAKKRGLLQIKEVAGDLVKLLQVEGIRSRIVNGQCKICFF